MHEKYMLEALKEAEKALNDGEVPVGAVLVQNGEIIGKNHNTRMKDNCVLGHAEINLLFDVTKNKSDWRLNDSILYVTLLPCPMCAGAINQARVKKVVCGTVPNSTNYQLIYNILNDNNYGSSVEIFTGVLEDECAELLKKFFSEKR